MKVKELIEHLKECNLEGVVVIKMGRYGYKEASSVDEGFFIREAESFQPDHEEEGDTNSVLIE